MGFCDNAQKGNRRIKLSSRVPRILSTFAAPMARAKNKTKHAQGAREEKDTLTARAVVFYRLEQQKVLGAGEKRMSLRSVCRKFEGAYKVDTGKSINIDHNT